MGYFSNGTEGELYHEIYCARCVHDEHEGCAVWSAHLSCNYDECNKPDSILHMLIPRSKGGGNERCEMFISATRHARAIEALRGCVEALEHLTHGVRDLVSEEVRLAAALAVIAEEEKP